LSITCFNACAVVGAVDLRVVTVVQPCVEERSINFVMHMTSPTKAQHDDERVCLVGGVTTMQSRLGEEKETQGHTRRLEHYGLVDHGDEGAPAGIRTPDQTIRELATNNTP
jgi:hypothetical protein